MQHVRQRLGVLFYACVLVLLALAAGRASAVSQPLDYPEGPTDYAHEQSTVID